METLAHACKRHTVTTMSAEKMHTPCVFCLRVSIVVIAGDPVREARIVRLLCLLFFPCESKPGHRRVSLAQGRLGHVDVHRRRPGIRVPCSRCCAAAPCMGGGDRDSVSPIVSHAVGDSEALRCACMSLLPVYPCALALLDCICAV